MRGGQVPVKGIPGISGTSHTKGGQAPVRQVTRGIRDGGSGGNRGCVSPLGGASQSYSGDNSKYEERRERPGRS